MQRVQFTEIIGGAFTESSGVKSGQMLFLRKLLEDPRGGALDMRVVGEQMPALADAKKRLRMLSLYDTYEHAVEKRSFSPV